MSDQQQKTETVKRPKLAAPARRRAESAVQGQQPADAGEAKEELGRALGRVTVAYGPYEQEFDLAGQTVAYAQDRLAHIFNIPQDALPVIAGTPVTDVQLRKLQAGERLEFMKDAGEKG